MDLRLPWPEGWLGLEVDIELKLTLTCVDIN